MKFLLFLLLNILKNVGPYSKPLLIIIWPSLSAFKPFYSFEIILFLAPIFCVNKSESYEICYRECALPLYPLKLRSSNVEIMVFRLIERNLWAITFA